MAMFNQTNKMDPIELFKWFQERKANAATPQGRKSNALGSKPGDSGTGDLSPVEDYFASMWEKTQQAIEAARKDLAPTMEEAARRSAEEAATLRSKMGITDSRDNLASVVASMGKGKDDMQEEASIPAPLPRPTKEDVALEIPAPLPRPEGKGLMTKATDGDSWLAGALDVVLKSEGGFQNQKEDSGNYRPDGTLIGTNKGITPKALAAYKGVDANEITVEDIKSVDDKTARDIYKQDYYEKPGIDKLPADLKEAVLDMYINSGPNAIKILQQKVGVETDGVIGPETIKAIADSNFTKDEYADARIEYYTGLANKNPEKKKYLKGWKIRANKYRD